MEKQSKKWLAKLLPILIYLLLGIRGAKGAPLPRLCFAQLVFV